MDEPLKFRFVREELRKSGMTLRRNVHGELEVYPVGRRGAATTYHTTDLRDALDTGIRMASEGKRR